MSVSELELDAKSRPGLKLENKYCVQMAKLVDALALGASGVTHEGSSPFLGTMFGFLLTAYM